MTVKAPALTMTAAAPGWRAVYAHTEAPDNLKFSPVAVWVFNPSNYDPEDEIALEGFVSIAGRLESAEGTPDFVGYLGPEDDPTILAFLTERAQRHFDEMRRLNGPDWSSR